MKTRLQIILSLTLILSCATQKKSENFVLDDDGIIVENSDKTKNYEQNYNNNNKIYSVGKTFTFSYFHIGRNGKKYLITKGREIQRENFKEFDWNFIEAENQNEETIKYIVLKPIAGNSFEKYISDYNQTGISYQFIQNNNKPFTMELTGAIENSQNVWIHPPRSSYFQILEMNPYPYIKQPYKTNSKWDWKLEIGDHWSDKRWLEWKGGIENHYNYEIIAKKKVQTKLGLLDCFIINGKAKSRIGDTELTSYFNKDFGFVKLDYKNVDGSKTVIELEKVE